MGYVSMKDIQSGKTSSPEKKKEVKGYTPMKDIVAQREKVKPKPVKTENPKIQPIKSEQPKSFTPIYDAAIKSGSNVGHVNPKKKESLISKIAKFDPVGDILKGAGKFISDTYKSTPGSTFNKIARFDPVGKVIGSTLKSAIADPYNEKSTMKDLPTNHPGGYLNPLNLVSKAGNTKVFQGFSNIGKENSVAGLNALVPASVSKLIKSPSYEGIGLKASTGRIPKPPIKIIQSPTYKSMKDIQGEVLHADKGNTNPIKSLEPMIHPKTNTPSLKGNYIKEIKDGKAHHETSAWIENKAAIENVKTGEPLKLNGFRVDRGQPVEGTGTFYGINFGYVNTLYSKNRVASNSDLILNEIKLSRPLVVNDIGGGAKYNAVLTLASELPKGSQTKSLMLKQLDQLEKTEWTTSGVAILDKLMKKSADELGYDGIVLKRKTFMKGTLNDSEVIVYKKNNELTPSTKRHEENNIAKVAASPTQSTYKSMKDIQDEVLHADTSNPIKLTDKEIAQRDRIDKFSTVEDNPIIPHTADQIQSKTVKESTPFLQKANSAYIKTVDNLHRINQFDQHVAKVTGKDLKPSDSGYQIGLNSRGSDMVTRQILEKNLVDSKGTVVGDSLKSVVKSIPQKELPKFEDYLVAKHSISRMGRGEKVYADSKNMTIQKAQMIVKEYETKMPHFKETAQKYYDYNKKMGQSWLVDTGILSQKQWDGYLEANPHYVPNNRIFSDLEKGGQFGSKKGFANQTMPIKKAEGSQRKIVSPIESTIENTAKYVKTAKQNEVFQTVYRNLQKYPEGLSMWGKIVQEDAKKSVDDILNKDGIEGLLDDAAGQFEKRTDLTKNNVISGFVDGQKVHIETQDKQFLEAMTNLSAPAQHFVMDSIGKITKVMKVVTTGLNPVFGLTRNIFRDIPMAFISSKTSNNPFVIGKDLLGSLVDVTLGRKAYINYKNMGGGHSSAVAADRNLLAQSKEKLLPSKGLGQTLKRNLLTKPFHALENLNNAIETAPRLGEFKRITKKGGNTYDSRIKGIYEANDVTTNFNRFGNYTKQADALFPYLNAAVQGLDKFVRVYKDNPKQAIAKSVAAITMPTVALYLLNHDNPDYQQLSNYNKDNFYMIPKGDGTFWKVAKTREMGMIFSTGIERALREFSQNDPEGFKDFGISFLNNFLPPGVSGLAQEGLPGLLGDTIAGPIQGLASNKNFAGIPIVPGSLDKLSPKLQYDTKTSEPAKKLGQLINYSPKKIDYLIKSYGGIIGQLGIPLTTKGGSLKDSLKQQVTADPLYSNDISRKFYDAMNKAATAKSDSKVTGKALENDLTPFFNRVANTLSQLRKQSNAIQKDDTLSRTEKKAQLDDIQKQMNEIQSNFMEAIK